MTKDDSPTKLGTIIKRLREEAGLTLYELGKRTGLNRSVLLRIETGSTAQPQTETLNQLARALNVEPELFYDAVWQDTDAPLPSPAVYFRSKYQLSDKQITELEASLGRLTNRASSRAPMKGGHHD